MDSRGFEDLTKIFSKKNLKSRQRKFAKYFSHLFSLRRLQNILQIKSCEASHPAQRWIFKKKIANVTMLPNSCVSASHIRLYSHQDCESEDRETGKITTADMYTARKEGSPLKPAADGRKDRRCCLKPKPEENKSKPQENWRADLRLSLWEKNQS